MLNRIFLIVFSLFFLLIGCMTSNFSQTGQSYEPLPEDYPVKVLVSGNKDDIKYDQLGILQIKQSEMNNLSKAIEYAMKKARSLGGDIILLITANSNSSVSGNQYGVFSSEENSFIFEIGRIKE